MSSLHQPQTFAWLESSPLTTQSSIYTCHITNVFTPEEAVEAFDSLVICFGNERGGGSCGRRVCPYAYRLSPQSSSPSSANTYTDEAEESINGSKDNGDIGTSDKLLYLLERYNVKDVIIIVSRWDRGVGSGGVGVKRYKHIVQVAKAGLDAYDTSTSHHQPSLSYSHTNSIDEIERMLGSYTQSLDSESLDSQPETSIASESVSTAKTKEKEKGTVKRDKMGRKMYQISTLPPPRYVLNSNKNDLVNTIAFPVEKVVSKRGRTNHFNGDFECDTSYNNRSKQVPQPPETPSLNHVNIDPFTNFEISTTSAYSLRSKVVENRLSGLNNTSPVALRKGSYIEELGSGLTIPLTPVMDSNLCTISNDLISTATPMTSTKPKQPAKHYSVTSPPELSKKQKVTLTNYKKNKADVPNAVLLVLQCVLILHTSKINFNAPYDQCLDYILDSSFSFGHFDNSIKLEEETLYCIKAKMRVLDMNVRRVKKVNEGVGCVLEWVESVLLTNPDLSSVGNLVDSVIDGEVRLIETESMEDLREVSRKLETIQI